MTDRLKNLPRVLRERAVLVRLAERVVPSGGVPALLAHPEEGWERAGARPSARPVVLWMHGRTVSKELDPGRYLRWLRAPGGGLGVCAIDLPGHGERFTEAFQRPGHGLELIEQSAAEVDRVVAALGEDRFNGAFDLSRVAIGGMSAGGMVTLVRLTRPHSFVCATVEAAAGSFSMMKGRGAFFTRGGRDPEGVMAARLDPARHVEGWRALPLLALHSEADEWVPVGAIRSFVDALKERYRAQGADPGMARLVTWASTGAPHEHAGFGRVSNEAKNIQGEFLAERLGSSASRADVRG